MALRKDGFYYNAQIVRYINQFMAIFQGLQVQIGKWHDQEEKLIPVDVRYAHPDRVVASIMAENVQNKPVRLPAMSAYIAGFELNMGRARGVGLERRNTYTPAGGLVPDDMTVILETGFPGAFDHIKYKGYTITTFEQEIETVPYAGKFFIFPSEKEVSTLDEARAFIDEQPALK